MYVHEEDLTVAHDGAAARGIRYLPVAMSPVIPSHQRADHVLLWEHILRVMGIQAVATDDGGGGEFKTKKNAVAECHKNVFTTQQQTSQAAPSRSFALCRRRGHSPQRY